MNATTDNRTPSDLEREGDQIRADLDRTLDEIQRRFDPGELMDRSMEFLRNNGSDLLREAGETIRRNPVPVALTAAGLLWLASSVVSSRRSGGSEDRYSYDRESYGRESYGRESYGRGGDGNWDSSGQGRVRNATRRVAETAKDKMSSAKDRMSSSMHKVQGRAQDAGSQLGDLVREQPLALGALALAAGALIGAALPTTEYENRVVGPVRDRTMERAKQAGERGYENIRQAMSSSQNERRGSGGESGESRAH